MEASSSGVRTDRQTQPAEEVRVQLSVQLVLPVLQILYINLITKILSTKIFSVTKNLSLVEALLRLYLNYKTWLSTPPPPPKIFQNRGVDMSRHV